MRARGRLGCWRRLSPDHSCVYRNCVHWRCAGMRRKINLMIGPTNPRFEITGMLHFRGALKSRLDELRRAFEDLPQDAAGVRLHGISSLESMLIATGDIGSIAARVIGAKAKPVRAIAFDKSPRTNWSLGWHQDRTICVRTRLDVAGFGPWTLKAGLNHVEPPFELLAHMVTLRVHLDDVPRTNAPLLVSPGSHRFGRIPVGDVEEVVERCGIRACLAKAGDVWLYATPILHASEAASSPSHRRVLQVDFAAEPLPGGLEWLGI